MARWRVTPGFKDNSLKADIKYDEHGSTMKVEQDEKPFIDMIKACLLYTSPSPRDS